jgi:FkbM family methyltransferase
MLIDLADLIDRHGLTVEGVVHCGAHEGQEAERYAACDVGRVLWIEGDPEHTRALARKLAPYPLQEWATAMLDETPRRRVFHRADSADGTNRGQSSSLLELGTHATVHPDVEFVGETEVDTFTLDQVMHRTWPSDERYPTMANLDLQGMELDVLRGAPQTLAALDLVYTEVNVDELYKGGTLLPGLDAFLVAHGFECIEVKLAGSQTRLDAARWLGWGDGVWRRSATPRPLAETWPDLWAEWCS